MPPRIPTPSRFSSRIIARSKDCSSATRNPGARASRRSSRTRSALELSVHTTIEEELFYPAIKDTVEEEIYDEAYVEHDGAKALIAEILAGTPDDDFYDAKVKVLSEMIKHHVKEEEQRGGMFAQAKDDGDVDLVALGAAMAARKKELAGKMKIAGVPTPATRSMKGAALHRAAPGCITRLRSLRGRPNGAHSPNEAVREVHETREARSRAAAKRISRCRPARPTRART